MATTEGLQILLALPEAELAAVVNDRRRAFAEAQARVEEAQRHFPPEGVAYAALGAREAAQQRVEEASLALDMRNAALRAQIAQLEEL